MSRPVKDDSIYKVSIHHNAGYDYAATHPYTLTPDGKRKYSIIHWGTVTENLQFVPGKRWYAASEEERAKLIFPEDWDLRHIKDTATKDESNGIDYKLVSIISSSLVIVLLLAGFLMRPRVNKAEPTDPVYLFSHANTSTSVEELMLSDNTKVFLSPLSEIHYDVSSLADRRIVSLEGEAFFVVEKDTLRPFVVSTRNISVKVLGTSFSVRSSASFPDTEVVLEHGSVVLSNENGVDILTLAPDQKAIYHSDGGSLSVESVNSAPVMAERFSLVSMENASLDEILESLHKDFETELAIQGKYSASAKYQFNYLKTAQLRDIISSLEFLSGTRILVNSKEQ